MPPQARSEDQSMVSYEIQMTKQIASAELQVARHASLELRSILPAGVPPWLLLVLERQEGINKANTRLNAINIAGKLMLVSRIDKLQRELDLKTGLALELECRLNHQQASIRELEGSVAQLSLEGELLKDEQLELKATMETEGARMRADLACQQQQLEAHRAELDTSKGVIQQLKALCTGQDFVVDSAILLSSLWLSSFQLFQMPLAMIARLAPRGIRGGRTAVLQILRLLVTLLLARHTKTVAVKYRLHSTLGSLNLYGRFVTEYLREKINPNSVLTNGAQAESGAGGEGCADNNDTG